MRRWLAEWWAGIYNGVAPMMAKELRARSRGWRPVALLTVYLGALAFGVTGFLWLRTTQSGTIGPDTGMQVFATLAVGFVLLLAFVTPALSVGSISGERERKTLDLLLVTRASALGIALGKLFASVFYVLYLLLAALPAFALVYLFGGVPVGTIGLTLGAAAATAVAYGALGQLLSALFRRTQVASVVAYFLVFMLVFGTPFLGLVARQTMQRRGDGLPGPPPVYVHTSPLSALAAVTPGMAPGAGIPLLSGILNELFGMDGRVMKAAQFGPRPAATTAARPWFSAARIQYVVAPPAMAGEEPKTVEAWAPWVYHFAFSAGIVVLAVAGTAWRLGAGRRRWLRRRRRRAA